MTLEEQLIRDEGEVLNLYYDSLGIPTIGVGGNLRDVKVPQEIAKQITITPEASRQLLRLRIEQARNDVALFLPWTATLDEVRRDVLVMMVFNMGAGGLLRHNPKTLAACERGDYAEAAREMLDGPWKSQVGERAVRLAKQMASGERQ